MNEFRAFLKTLFAKAYGTYFNLVALFSPRRAAKLAFSTFAKVRKGRVQPPQKDFLHGAKHSLEAVAGHQIQTYQWPGTGPRVLLIHGWESNTFRWRNLIGILRESGFHIIAFDAPAHGYSSGKILHVPLYAECVEHMVQAFNPVYIIGHSVGGMTALYHAHRHPENSVEKVVTIGSPAEFEEIVLAYQKMLGFSDRVLRAFDALIHKEFGFYMHEFASPRFVEGNPRKGMLLHDKLDRIAPFHASQKVHNAWKDSVLVPTEGLGHSMHQEEVNRKIVDFLKS